MVSFVKRILASEGLTVHSDMEDQFTGFIPFYSGTNSTQTLHQMRQELAGAAWVGHISSLEVENALDTLKNERLSQFSNASAYAIIVANALATGDNKAAARVMVEDDLLGRPIALAAQE